MNLSAAAPEAKTAPMVLVETGARGVVIGAVNRSAAAAGIVVGQSLADARAAFPALRTRPMESPRDAAALAALAVWLGRYGSARNVDGSDGLWVDISGVPHLFGGEQALLEDCHRRLREAGFEARLGLADTVTAAWALARYGRQAGAIVLAPAAGTRAALADLPVESLRLTPATVTLLKRLGLYRVSDLYALPRAGLVRRFRDRGGTSGLSPAALADGVILRLDQALGVIREPRRPLSPVPCRLVRQVFTEPLISATGVEVAVSAAIAGLCEILEEAGDGMRRLCLILYRTDGSQVAVEAGTSMPSRDQRHLGRLLAEKLPELDLGFGVDVLTLEAVTVERLDEVQPGFGANSKEKSLRGLEQLVDRLSNRLSAGAVRRIVPRACHIPEEADRGLPATGPPGIMANMAAGQDRPAFLLPAPEPIEVVAEVPDGPPRRFLWRRAPHRVVKAEGPERIEPTWWQLIGLRESATARPRDYYRVEDDRGGRYWVFRSGLYEGFEAGETAPSWFMHGLFG